MAAVTNTAELMKMLNQGQDELKRSMHDLAVLNSTNKRHDKKSLFKVHPTSLKPTRKRARTQQLAADQVYGLFHIIMLQYFRVAGITKTTGK